MKDGEKWCRKYTEWYVKLHWTFYNLFLLLYLFCFAILWKPGGNQEKTTAWLQRRRKEKPLPLWAVITSQYRWLPTPLWENPWLLSCSCGATQTAEQTAVISVGKTKWVYPFYPACLLRRFQLLTLAHHAQHLWCSTQDDTKHCSPARTVVPSHVWGDLCAFSHVSLLVFG